MRYITKSGRTVEAIQYTGNFSLNEMRKAWEWTTFSPGAVAMTVMTYQGDFCVKQGDWIIRTQSGFFYPCPDNEFAKQYSKVDDSAVRAA